MYHVTLIAFLSLYFQQPIFPASERSEQTTWKKRPGNYFKFLHQEILLLQWNFLGCCHSSTTEWPYFQGKLLVDFVVHGYVRMHPRWNKSNTTHPWPACILLKVSKEWERFSSKKIEECFGEHQYQKNNRDRSTGVTDKYLNSSLGVWYCSQCKH